MATYTITGGAGFIGSHLSDLLISQGHTVYIVDDLSTGSFDNIAHLKDHKNFHFAIDSINNEMLLDRLISKSDIVIHLAASVGVFLILKQPVQVLTNNISGTEVVLKTALRYKAKVLLASTSEVYGKNPSEPFREDDDVVLGPTVRSRWSYAASKMIDEFLGLAFNAEYGLPVTSFRLFNTVGPRQSAQYGMVIPRFVEQALTGKKLTIYGDGKQQRCFMHVNDAIQAIYALSTMDETEDKVFNIGATTHITIEGLAKLVVNKVHPGKDFKDFVTYIPYEEAYSNKNFEDMKSRKPDISRIAAATGWNPQIDMDEILDTVIEHTKRNLT